MSQIRRHNPLVESRLRQLLNTGDPDALLAYLSGLSNTDFRTAGFLLSEELLCGLQGDVFWKFFGTLVPAFPKAYLGTFLKAARTLYKNGATDFSNSVLDDFSLVATEIDAQKILSAFLPLCRQPEEVSRLLKLFCEDRTPSQISRLMEAGTSPCYFILFKLVKQFDHRPELLRRYCLLLMKKGDNLSFNLASIIKEYFDLSDLPGTFSLKLAPYTLSRLDESYDSFKKILLF